MFCDSRGWRNRATGKSELREQPPLGFYEGRRVTPLENLYIRNKEYKYLHDMQNIVHYIENISAVTLYGLIYYISILTSTFWVGLHQMRPLENYTSCASPPWQHYPQAVELPSAHAAAAWTHSWASNHLAPATTTGFSCRFLKSSYSQNLFWYQSQSYHPKSHRPMSSRNFRGRSFPSAQARSWLAACQPQTGARAVPQAKYSIK